MLKIFNHSDKPIDVRTSIDRVRLKPGCEVLLGAIEPYELKAKRPGLFGWSPPSHFDDSLTIYRDLT